MLYTSGRAGMISRVRMLSIHVMGRTFNVDLGPAETARAPLRRLGRQLATGLPHCVFPHRHCTLAPVLGEIGFCDLQLDLASGSLKGGACFRKIAGYAVVANASVRCWVYRDSPPPLLGVNRHAGAHSDRSNMDIISEDQPVIGFPVFVPTTGERRHRPRQPVNRRPATCLALAGEAQRATARRGLNQRRRRPLVRKCPPRLQALWE